MGFELYSVRSGIAAAPPLGKNFNTAAVSPETGVLLSIASLMLVDTCWADGLVNVLEKFGSGAGEPLLLISTGTEPELLARVSRPDEEGAAPFTGSKLYSERQTRQHQLRE